MFVKLTSFLALFMLFCMSATAQEEIDARVLKNRGKQAEEAFRHNRNSYNYYVFELDKSYYVVPVSQLTPQEHAQLQTATTFKNTSNEPVSIGAVDSGNFNFYEYGIRLQKENRVYIALNESKALVFYSIPELSQLFKNSEFNTK